MSKICERHVQHPVHVWIESAIDSDQSIVVPSTPTIVSTSTSRNVSSHLSLTSSFASNEEDDEKRIKAECQYSRGKVGSI
jgi:hypothetical protein